MSDVMKMAILALAKVATWSKAKQDYAKRATAAEQDRPSSADEGNHR